MHSDIFELSGIGDQERIAISDIALETRELLEYLNPDDGPNPAVGARHLAASKWEKLKLTVKAGHDKRVKPYFQDAIGPGFMLPGCSLAVGESAKQILEPYLGDKVRFLSLDVVGSPCPYWAFYATEYYSGELDMDQSIFRPPYSSASDRRQMLRAAAFPSSKELDEMYVFRVPGTAEYVVPDITYATKKFLELVVKLNLGGFTFSRIHFRGFKARSEDNPVYVSPGPKYFPNW
jgi:hypothetical protein